MNLAGHKSCILPSFATFIMNWPGDDVINGVPVVLTGRPGRLRNRHGSEHMNRQTVFVQDHNGLLIPAAALGPGGLQRSTSVSGHGRRSPTQIIINNSQREDHSPVQAPRRRSVHHEPRFEDDDWDDRAHSPPRRERERRQRSRVRHRHERHESRSPSPYFDLDMERKLRKLEDLEKKEEEARQRKRYEEELLVKDAEKAARKKREEELTKAAIAEYNLKQREKEAKEKKEKDDLIAEYNLKQKEKEAKEKKEKDALIAEYNAKQKEKAEKEKKEKEEAEKAFRERVKATFGKAGYSDKSIERILEKEKGGNSGQMKIMDLTRPTYIKVHRKHLSPDTLDAYDLPWEWDDVSLSPLVVALHVLFPSISVLFQLPIAKWSNAPPSGAQKHLVCLAHSYLTHMSLQRDTNYIVIKRWIPEHEQDMLFEHTRKMREGRLLTNTTVELKRERDNLLLVRKKSPVRKRSASRSWMFT